MYPLSKDTFRTTAWRYFPNGGPRRPQIRVTYGMHYVYGNSAPYFSITGDIRDYPTQREENWSGGCCHDDIRLAFPELQDLIPWHLANQDGLPMHYFENGKFWFDKIGKPLDKYDTGDPVEHFKDTVIFGIVPGETFPTSENIDQWLLDRIPALSREFLATMNKHGVKLIPGYLHKQPIEGKPKTLRQWWGE